MGTGLPHHPRKTSDHARLAAAGASPGRVRRASRAPGYPLSRGALRDSPGESRSRAGPSRARLSGVAPATRFETLLAVSDREGRGSSGTRESQGRSPVVGWQYARRTRVSGIGGAPVDGSGVRQDSVSGIRRSEAVAGAGGRLGPGCRVPDPASGSRSANRDRAEPVRRFRGGGAALSQDPGGRAAGAGSVSPGQRAGRTRIHSPEDLAL